MPDLVLEMFLKNKNKNIDIERERLTRIGSGNYSSARKITSSRNLFIPLEIAIDSVAAVSPHGIRVETGCVLMDRVAVRPGSTCIV